MTDILAPRIFNPRNGLAPPEGPRSIAVTFDWTVQPVYEIDMLNVTQTNKVSQIQTVYVDNYDNEKAVDITGSSLGQRVRVPAFGGAYLPVLVPTPPVFVLTSMASTAKTVVNFLNFAMPPAVWSAPLTGPTYNGNGALVTNDENILGSMYGSRLGTASMGLAYGDNLVPVYLGSSFWMGTVTSAMTNATIIPASAGEGWYITAIECTIAPGSAAATPTVNYELRDAGTVIMRDFARLPVTAPAALDAAVGLKLFSVFGSFQYNSKTTGGALTINSSVLLTAGNVSITVFGGRTASTAP